MKWFERVSRGQIALGMLLILTFVPIGLGQTLTSQSACPAVVDGACLLFDSTTPPPSTLREIEIEAPRDGNALVTVNASAICGHTGASLSVIDFVTGIYETDSAAAGPNDPGSARHAFVWGSDETDRSITFNLNSTRTFAVKAGSQRYFFRISVLRQDADTNCHVYSNTMSVLFIPPPSRSSQITITPTLPTELNRAGGGAPNATLEQAAFFAWQEFIAAVWPAVEQNGQPNERDAPDTNCRLGDQSSPCAGRPLVWETFRGKVELFPGSGGVDASYDALPDYRYVANVAACEGNKPARAAWVNLDETDEITLAAMYAGIAPPADPRNSAPQLIRFLAKGNRVQFDYAQKLRATGKIKNQLGDNGGGNLDASFVTATKQFLRTNGDPPPGDLEHVSLPTNTVEIKAGWRLLNPEKEDTSRFHTALVRYYERSGDAPCFREAVWGLVALHIIQKTESAPYFIYATFEQADNIRDRNGNLVEDDDGRAAGVECPQGQSSPCPRTPNVALIDNGNVMDPPKVEIRPAGAAYCSASLAEIPPNQLYYLNRDFMGRQPSMGYICVNGRDNPIPLTIVDVNAAAHAAIRNYDQRNGIADSPWLHYKLLNVQYKPIDKTEPIFFPGNDPATANNPATYYLANIVVETNLTLQLFSGGLFGGAAPNSDFAAQFPQGGFAGQRVTQPNMFYKGAPLNMGGCMGCHGGQGQNFGGDFSVIFARGAVSEPEVPPRRTDQGEAMSRRNRTLFAPSLK